MKNLDLCSEAYNITAVCVVRSLQNSVFGRLVNYNNNKSRLEIELEKVQR